MKNNAPSHCHLLLEQSQLAHLKQKSMQIMQLDKSLKTYIAPFIHPHIRLSNIRNNVVIIEVSSASYKNMIFREQMNLLALFRQQSPHVVNIDIKINPGLYQQQHEPNVTPAYREVSNTSAEHIRMVAEFLPPAIKEKLLNIARLAKEI